MFRAGGLAARGGERRESRQRRVEEPAEPNAFAFALFADAVHAVVPVAGADERKSVAADRPGSDRARARNAQTESLALREIVG